MEPITHLMTGACLARAGCNRNAAYATLAMTIAAEAPDLDTLSSIVGPHAGPVASFQHHRGITHTFLGIPFEGAVVLGAVWLLHRWRVRRASIASAKAVAVSSLLSSRSVAEGPASPRTTVDSSDLMADQPIPHPLTAAPVRWSLLYGFVLIALLSHILLDWTNNYGVRPFFPFNPRWYADSIVFIFEPVLFAALLIGLTAPALFGLIGSEVGAHKPAFRGRGWAIFALIATLALWGWRQIEHDAAIRLASMATYGPADSPASEILRVTVSPYPINPYHWHTVVETPDFYQLASVDALRATVSTYPEQDILYKPPTTLATLVAKRSWLGEVYLDWSTWPIVTDIGPVGGFTPQPFVTTVAAPPGTTVVTFRDLRFMYDTFLINGRRSPPLSATVYLNADRRVVAMEMGGKPQE